MCGRFLLNSDISYIIKNYRIYDARVSKYNTGDFYPSQKAITVFKDKSRTISLVKWGFPYSNKNKIIINARSETIAEKPMFKDSIRTSRCVIPANLFYEWKDEGKKKKVKYKIGLKDRDLISMGAIYKLSTDQYSNRELTFVIITTEARGDMKEIHSRMPLILNNDEVDDWLNNNTSLELIEEILNKDSTYKFAIEKCEDEYTKSTNGEKYEQLRMF